MSLSAPRPKIDSVRSPGAIGWAKVLAVSCLGAWTTACVKETPLADSLATAAASSESVRLDTLTEFAWDRVCILTPYMTPAEGRQRLGFNVPVGASTERTDHDNVLVFSLNGGSIVYARIPRSSDFASGWDCLAATEARFQARDGVFYRAE